MVHFHTYYNAALVSNVTFDFTSLQLVNGFTYTGPSKVALLAADVFPEKKTVKIMDLGAGTGICGEFVSINDNK